MSTRAWRSVVFRSRDVLTNADGQHCENEYCYLMAARYDGTVTPNPDHAHSFRWITWEQLTAELAENPQDFTPWLKVAVERLSDSGIEHVLNA